MEWKLSDEQEAYQQAFRGWLGDVAPTDRLREWYASGDVSDFGQRFTRDGWLGVGVPEERGGQGGGAVELAVTAEELGRAAAPSAGWLATVLAAGAVPSLPEGGLGWLSPAETAPGSAVPNLSVSGDRVSGLVPRVLAGATATTFVVTVGEPGAPSLRLVEAGSDGVAVTPRHLLDRSRAVADVALTDAPSTTLDVDVDGARARADGLAAVLAAADSLGATQRMLDLAVEYSKQRRQFGVPIGSFQAVKHAAATIEVGVEASRSAVYFAAASLEAGQEDADLHAAAVKAQVTAAGSRAADLALTMHGAIGYTWEHDLHLFYKRARLDEHLFGSPVWWNERIADRLELV